MNQKVEMFLMERDRAEARGDWGVVRSTTADLRRMGVPDEATLDVAPPVEPKPRRGRPPKPRCEHDRIVERCIDCNEELSI